MALDQRSPRRSLALSLTSLVLLALFGCATTEGGTAGPASSDTRAEEVLAEGTRLYRKRCVACHGLYAPVRYSDDSWAQIMPGMAQEANITAREAAIILAYLQTAN